MRNFRFRSFVLFSVLMVFMGMFFKPAHAIGSSGSLSGTVTDKSTGKPVENVFVSATSAGQTYTANTDANGFYSLASMPAATYSVKFERVGYQAITYDGIVVAADASTSLDAGLSTEVYKVQGVTVTGYRDVTTNPRVVMTNYGYSDKLVREVFPGPANLGITALYATMPGVVSTTDPYFGTANHVRGGTGNDIGYAFDGIPTYETITGTFGGNLSNVGTNRTDFYVGAYPVGYGNYPSGYVNQVVQRGYGPPHGSLELQWGFWVDKGSNLPSLDPVTQNVTTYNGQSFPNPFTYNLTFMGQDRKFHYYFNQIGQNGSLSTVTGAPFVTGVDLKPLLFLGSNELAAFQEPERNTVVNLNYDLDTKDDLQLLLSEGELTAYYFGVNNPTGTPTAMVPQPDQSEPQKFDLEKLEWHHRFSPDKVLSMRLWRYDTDVWFNFFDSPTGNIGEWRGSWEKGIQAEYQDQLDEHNLLNIGGFWYYSSNHYWLGITLPNAAGPFNSALVGAPFGDRETTGNPYGNTGVGVPDTQSMSAWLSDEWRPFPKFTLTAGLRWDRQNYLVPNASKIDISPWMEPNDPSASNIEAHKLFTAANGMPFSLGGCNTTGVTNFCFDPGFLHPSFITPRVGASYQVTDNFTVKASYGKFFTYAPARLVGMIKTLSAGAAPAPYLVHEPAVYMKPGSRPQFAEDTDVSLEYHMLDNAYVKVTPYIKHIQNPLVSVLLPGGNFFSVNAGTIKSEGIEFLAKTDEWNGLTGWLSYTYSKTVGTQLPEQNESGNIGSPVNLPASVVVADFNKVVPAPYDIPHVASLQFNYKVPGGKWEVAPNFTFQSGQAYGLGTDNLCLLAAVEGVPGVNPAAYATGGCTKTPNPLNEPITPDGLRFGSVLFGNLAVTYHVNNNLSSTLSIFNLWNSARTYGPDTESYSFVGAEGYPFTPQYDPLKGQYYNLGIPALRQFVLTMHYDF